MASHDRNDGVAARAVVPRLAEGVAFARIGEGIALARTDEAIAPSGIGAGASSARIEESVALARIGDGIALAQRGEREAARRVLEELWTDVAGDGRGKLAAPGEAADRGDPLHRCAIAHHLADVQDDPRDELAWDLRALEAVAALTDERIVAAGIVGAVAGWYPSLHLNVGESYRKVGDLAAARRHLALGLAAARALDDDGYDAMIKRGLAALATRLASG